MRNTLPAMEPTLTVRQQIAANVRAEAARRDASQDEVAQILQITQPAVNRKFRASRPFTIEELSVLASWWGISLSVFLPDNPRGVSAA